MTWQLVTAANLIIAAVFLVIVWIVLSGLTRSGQLGTNRLGVATGLIFLAAALHHGAIGVRMLLPSVDLAETSGLALRHGWDWTTIVIDFFGAAVGLFYLSLRGSYASVLRGAQMFEDLRIRERQALEINDNIVQGLTVAKYALDSGADGKSREAIQQTLSQAQAIISELMATPGRGGGPSPGDLRRAAAARPSLPGRRAA
jgi:hypothetical protein